MKATSEEVIALSSATATIVALVGAIVGLVFALFGHDEVIRLHGLFFLTACSAAAIYVTTHPRSGGAEEQHAYFDGPARVATLAAVFWGVVGFLVGTIIALQLAFPALNFDLPWTNFGRLRPLHTSAVIFAFGGHVLLATSFYVVQRTCRARIAGELSPWFVVLGYNLFIVLAGTGYLLGITQGKEY